MKAREFIVESAKTASAEQVWNYVDGIHPDDQKGGGFLKKLILRYPQYELQRVPLSSLHLPDQEYDDEDQEPEQDPYNRVQTVDPAHAGEYSQHFVDRRPIVVDSDGWIIDGNHRAWAAANLLNRSDIQAWVPVKQLTELGNAPADYKPNRKRKRSLFHSTVDGHWVDVFFDRSEFNGTLHITFAVDGNYDTPSMPTSASKSTVKILSTVLDIVKRQLPEYIAKARPPGISFTAKGDNRTSLYRKYFVPVVQNILGSKWQHEEYPSMGMTVFHWKPAKKQGVTEVFNQPYAFRWDSDSDNNTYNAHTRLPDGTSLEINFYTDPGVDGDEDWVVEFWRNRSLDITGAGDAQRVFATVLTAIGQFIEMQEPETVRFTADKDVEPGQKPMSRSNLYDRLVQRYAQAWGYRLDRSDMADTTVYLLYRIR
jgi:hypothetical protein